MDAGELREWLSARNQPSFRTDQIFEWIYRHNAESFEQMSNLPLALRAWLAEKATILRGSLLRESRSNDGTSKLLLHWPDGATVETVCIPATERATVCLSSQVGCPVGCRFCASGIGGLERNLTAGEIVEQALRGRTAFAPQRLTNIVLMGIGEPLANYEAVVKAIRIMNAPWGLGVGARRITLSTVGLPKQIRRLAREDLQINLAVSLHAADDALRRELIPWDRGAPLAELLDACAAYFKQTGRELTLEYVLLDGINNRTGDADKLAAIAKRLRANVNLLRYNPVDGVKYGRPSAVSAYEFQKRLRSRGVNAHVRTSRGRDADAACGQLRHRDRTDPAPNSA
jgi:23S rRNA (adenine2503-C2)-methyltransferase